MSLCACACVYMCACACVCMCVHVCVYVYVCFCVCVCACMCVCVCVVMCMNRSDEGLPLTAAVKAQRDRAFRSKMLLGAVVAVGTIAACSVGFWWVKRRR